MDSHVLLKHLHQPLKKGNCDIQVLHMLHKELFASLASNRPKHLLEALIDILNNCMESELQFAGDHLYISLFFTTALWIYVGFWHAG